MNVTSYQHPVRFYFLSTIIPWIFWFIAAYLSHSSSALKLVGVLGLLGLLAPVMVAFIMMKSNPNIKNDFGRRIFNFSRIKKRYLFFTFFLMLGSILLAQLISLLFGHSVDQFSLSSSASFSYGLFPAWFLLFLAPIFEELAWHSYGTDCLRARFSLFTTSIIFGVIWIFWHLPLGFIKDYYHSNVAESGWIYSLNFAVSLIPFVLLMNWLYYKTGRNITVAIIFHITAGLFNEMFQTHPDSKVIQTGLLLLLTVLLVFREKRFFFERKYEEDQR